MEQAKKLRLKAFLCKNEGSSASRSKVPVKTSGYESSNTSLVTSVVSNKLKSTYHHPHRGLDATQEDRKETKVDDSRLLRISDSIYMKPMISNQKSNDGSFKIVNRFSCKRSFNIQKKLEEKDESHISLSENNKKLKFSNGRDGKTHDDVLTVKESKKDPSSLRPIIIDGNNVAKEHGKATKTFSSKGIQLCVNYFIERGHTQLSVFLPKFRQHSENLKLYPTTDCSILEDLDKKHYLVYTPSRFLNGKMIIYDNNFMIQCAAKTGGIIVSNSNFNAFACVPSYKEVVEKRILMYCFVGDYVMIPEDPLGRNGPKLPEFLSFP